MPKQVMQKTEDDGNNAQKVANLERQVTSLKNQNRRYAEQNMKLSKGPDLEKQVEFKKKKEEEVARLQSEVQGLKDEVNKLNSLLVQKRNENAKLRVQISKGSNANNKERAEKASTNAEQPKQGNTAPSTTNTEDKKKKKTTTPAKK